jgi:elongation factor P
MADTSDFRNGLVLNFKNDLWQIIEFQHVKPGKGGAFVRSKLKNLRNGKVVDNTFRAGEKVETVRVERRQMQYLYQDDLGMHFMNTDTYEQIVMPPEAVEGREYLKEGGTIDISFDTATEKPVTTEMAPSVELLVTQADPGLKGDTSSGATKPVTVESGATINVPLFINEGDVIRVSTTDGTYSTRVSAA